MDWTSLISNVLIFVLPLILTYIFGRLGIDKIKYARYQFLLDKAHEAVLEAADRFQDNQGVQKLKYATNQVINALIKAGYHVTTAEAESAVRAEYKQAILDSATGTLSN